MTHLTAVGMSRSKAKYRDVLSKGLRKFGIEFSVKSGKVGKHYYITNEHDVEQARRFLLSISLCNPQYI
jgi:hypothetical protein